MQPFPTSVTLGLLILRMGVVVALLTSESYCEDGGLNKVIDKVHTTVFSPYQVESSMLL